MKVLITGGAGFIGSHVVDLMVAAGHDVVVVDNLSTGRAANLNPQARFYQVDLRSPDLEAVFEQERPEVVNHHAAQIDVRRSVSDPVFDAENNIMGGIRLFTLAAKFGVRKVIYISSGGAVYGEPVYLPCDENHPIQPLCPYGASKYTLELYLALYQKTFGLDYSVLRYTNIYGPRQDPAGEAGVISIFIGRMLNGELVTIYGGGEQVRDFLYVADCARANLLLLQSGSGCVYNLGSGSGITINQLFARLQAITGYAQEARSAPGRPGETFKIFLDSSRARQELGWTPTVDLEEGLRQTVAFFKASRE